MPDPYYDKVISLAISISGIWLADGQSAASSRITFESDRAVRETVPKLIDTFQREAWRVSELAQNEHRASMLVLSEIDRQCQVCLVERTADSI